MNISLVLAVLVALIAIPVYLTGEPAEELVEDVPGVSESIMEQHEESAEISFILMEVTGALALISIIVLAYSEKFGRRLCTLTLLMLVISGGFMVWTANLGGKINHPEIRSGSYNQGSQDTEYYEREDDD